MQILGIIASSIAKSISDLFNRTTSGSLGTTNTGQIWNAIRGVWFANGTAAQSNNTATDYAIAAIPFGPSATINTDTTGGCGLAFWVTDANSWWAAVPHYSTSVNTTCTGGTAFCYTAGCTPANSCGTISETTGSNTTCTGGTAYCYSAGCTPANSCGTIQQTTGSNTTCTGGTAFCYTAGCTPANSCGTISQSTGSSCTGSQVQCSDSSNTCNPGGCGTISSSSSSTYGCTNPYYTWLCGQQCFELRFCQGASISATVTGTTYTRTQNTTVTTYTRSSPTNVTTTTYTRWSPTNVTTTTYTRSSPTNVSTTTYISAARILKSVSGTVTTELDTTLNSNTSAFANIASMQVNTNGTTITVKGYSGAGQTTQMGSTVTRVPTTPVTGSSVGIIKAPTTNNQGSTVDNFSAAF